MSGYGGQSPHGGQGFQGNRGRDNRRENKDEVQSEFTEKVVSLNRVSKTV